MHETATNALRRNAAGYENEFAIKGLDGSVRNLREVVRITPISVTEWDLVGVAMDVTEQEQAEQELQKSLSIVSATVESTEDGVLVVSKLGKIVFFNSRFAEMWGIPEHIILSCDDSQSMQFASNLLIDPDAFIKKIEDGYSQPDAIYYDILKFKDGRVFERHSHPQRSGAESSGRVWVFRDISKRTRMEEQLAAANARLIKLVKEDVLTGFAQPADSVGIGGTRMVALAADAQAIFGSAHRHRRLQKNQRSARTPHRDRALKLIADALKLSTRNLDMVGRYGGEEFIVILPETPLEGATVVAEKVLDAIRQLKLLSGTQTIQLTASIGATAANKSDKDIDALIHRAIWPCTPPSAGGKTQWSRRLNRVNGFLVR